MQNNQDIINLISKISSDPSPAVGEISQRQLPNDDVFSKGTLMFVRIVGVKVSGPVSAYYQGSPVLLIDGEKNFDTGGIYLLCDQVDGIGVSEGLVTIEGYYY